MSGSHIIVLMVTIHWYHTVRSQPLRTGQVGEITNVSVGGWPYNQHYGKCCPDIPAMPLALNLKGSR